MDNQQVSGILFENIDINKLTSKTINNNVAKNIIYNLHQEYKYFKDNYNLNGEGNSQAKLTKDDVLYIRANIIDKKELANKYGVSVATIYDIIKGRSWKHI